MSPRLFWPFPPIGELWGGLGSRVELELGTHCTPEAIGLASIFLFAPRASVGSGRAVTAARPMSPSSQAATCLNS